MERKIRTRLQWFAAYVRETYGHKRLSMVVRRDVAAGGGQLDQAQPRGCGLAPATVNLDLAHLRGCLTWVRAHDVDTLSQGDPARGVKDLPLPALQPRALGERQVRSLKEHRGPAGRNADPSTGPMSGFRGPRGTNERGLHSG